MMRQIGDVSARDAEAPFGTADVPDEIVNQRFIITVATGDDETGQRRGPWGLWVWVDNVKVHVGDPLGTPDPATYRGTNGAGLTRDERRMVATTLHIAAHALIQSVDKP